MNERDLNAALLEAFPELAREFEEYTAWQDGMDTGAFLTYEDICRPRIERAVAQGDVLFAERAFAFIEKLFLSNDGYAVNVITVGILEGLKANCDNESVRPYLKDITRREFENLTH